MADIVVINIGTTSLGRGQYTCNWNVNNFDLMSDYNCDLIKDFDRIESINFDYNLVLCN